MANAKKKSSGWRPDEKRRTPQQWQGRMLTARMAELRRDGDRLALWRACPAKLCLRFRRCTGDPGPCLEQRRPKIAAPVQVAAAELITAEAARSAVAATGNKAHRFALSASDAAAAIAASIADVTAPELLHGEQLEAIIRDGRIHYEPRRRR